MATLALLTQVGEWWDARSVAEQLFYGIGFTAGFAAIVLMVLSVIGFEHDDALDALTAGDIGHAGDGIFSVKPLTGFFLAFGWVGGMSLESGASIPVATVLAVISGGGVMAALILLFRAILRMKSDGTARIEDAVGATGTVYLTLPANRGSGGQVTVSFRGRQETYAALQAGEIPVPAGEKVRVVQIVDTRTVLVERHL